MQHSLTEKIGPWINAAIDKHGQGEAIAWEPGLQPGQGGVAIYTVCVWFPGGLIGTTHTGAFQINDPLGVTEEKIDEVMAEFLRQLREKRSQQIAEASNGHQPPGEQPRHPSGLILPT